MPWETLSCENTHSLITDNITIKVILGSNNKNITSLVITGNWRPVSWEEYQEITALNLGPLNKYSKCDVEMWEMC